MSCKNINRLSAFVTFPLLLIVTWLVTRVGAQRFDFFELNKCTCTYIQCRYLRLYVVALSYPTQFHLRYLHSAVEEIQV